MNINKIDNTNFKSGDVILKRINSPNALNCYASLKKIAEDKNIDIYIMENENPKYLPKVNMFTVMAVKEFPIVLKKFLTVVKSLRMGIGCVIISKSAGEKELSVKIYNAAVSAIETLEKRLADKNEG